MTRDSEEDGGRMEENEEGEGEEYNVSEGGEGEEEQQEEEEDRERVDKKKLKKGDRIKGKEIETGENKRMEILSRAGKMKSLKYGESYNVRDLEDGTEGWVNLKEWIELEKIEDEEEILLGYEDEKIRKAKRKEIQSWEENGVFEEVMDDGQKAISTRWIITEKLKKEGKICKARLVARGFEEEEINKELDAPTCRVETLKMTIAIILNQGWKCRNIDIKTAYLQGDEIKRDVWVKPPMEAETDNLWKLKKTVYGLKDAARAWYDTVTRVLENLGGKRCDVEPALFYWRTKGGEIQGVMCIHVDDFCWGGVKDFEETVISKLRHDLRVGEEGEAIFKYLGVNIEQRENETIMEQKNYIKMLEEVDEKRYKGSRELNRKEMRKYRSLIGQMNWVANQTRPDVAFTVSDLSRKNKSANTEDMRRAIKKVKRVKEKEREIRLKRLGKDKFIECYSDASYGNIDKEKSQIGYFIGVADKEGNRCPIYWKSRCAKRVARSTIEAETMGLCEAAESAIYIRHMWKTTTGEELPIVCRIDSKTLRTALDSTSAVESKRLRIDIASMKEMIEKGEIERVEWVNTKDQKADILTKEGVNEKSLEGLVY